MEVCDQGHLHEHSGMLQVAIGDVSMGICSRHDSVLDVEREWNSPHVGLVFVIEVDPAHAGFGSVSRSQEAWVLRDYLSEVGWPVSEACCERGKGVDVLPQGGVDAHTIAFRFCESQL